MILKIMEFFLFILPSYLKVFGDGFRYIVYCLHHIISQRSSSLAHVKSVVINDRPRLIPISSDLI